jgi:hypothetical protein
MWKSFWAVKDAAAVEFGGFIKNIKARPAVLLEIYRIALLRAYIVGAAVHEMKGIGFAYSK